MPGVGRHLGVTCALSGASAHPETDAGKAEQMYIYLSWRHSLGYKEVDRRRKAEMLLGLFVSLWFVRTKIRMSGERPRRTPKPSE